MNVKNRKVLKNTGERRKEEKVHKPVLVNEVIDGFSPQVHLNKQAQIVDATLGSGGHTIRLLKEGVRVIGIDDDESVIGVAEDEIIKACPFLKDNFQKYITLIQGNFKDIDTILKGVGIESVNGVLIDLGVNSMQLKSLKRGFSFENPKAPLDMRVNQTSQSVKGSDLLNALNEKQLMQVFEGVVGWVKAKRLVDKVIERRSETPFVSVGDFLEIVAEVFGKGGKTHYATKPFLALRMAVNSELENLEVALPKAFEMLGINGRLLVISFHSLEDGIVKKYFKSRESESTGRIITNKPIIPSEDEISINPRSRSAKLRIIEKI